MIRSILRLTPKNGDYDALLAYYRDSAILESVVSRGLCISGELQVPVERDGPVLVSCLWPSAQAYADWVRERAGGTPELIALLELDGEGVPAGQLLDVSISA